MEDIRQESDKLAGACDCHMHIYDPRFAVGAGAHPPARKATVADYLRVRERLGLGRVVVVQSTAYRDDNSCALDAMKQFGDSARGVASVAPDAPDAELARLTAAGMRGLRYVMLPGRPMAWETMPVMAPRIAQFGWNINLQLPGEELAARAAMLAGLACDVVIDHIGRFTAPFDGNTPGVRALLSIAGCGPLLGEAVGAVPRVEERPAALRGQRRACARTRAALARAHAVRDELAAPFGERRGAGRSRSHAGSCGSGRRMKRHAAAYSSTTRRSCISMERSHKKR